MEELIEEIKETKDKLKAAQDAGSADREEISYLRSLILSCNDPKCILQLVFISLPSNCTFCPTSNICTAVNINNEYIF